MSLLWTSGNLACSCWNVCAVDVSDWLMTNTRCTDRPLHGCTGCHISLLYVDKLLKGPCRCFSLLLDAHQYQPGDRQSIWIPGTLPVARGEDRRSLGWWCSGRWQRSQWGWAADLRPCRGKHRACEVGFLFLVRSLLHWETHWTLEETTVMAMDGTALTRPLSVCSDMSLNVLNRVISVGWWWEIRQALWGWRDCGMDRRNRHQRGQVNEYKPAWFCACSQQTGKHSSFKNWLHLVSKFYQRFWNQGCNIEEKMSSWVQSHLHLCHRWALKLRELHTLILRVALWMNLNSWIFLFSGLTL